MVSDPVTIEVPHEFALAVDNEAAAGELQQVLAAPAHRVPRHRQTAQDAIVAAVGAAAVRLLHQHRLQGEPRTDGLAGRPVPGVGPGLDPALEGDFPRTGC